MSDRDYVLGTQDEELNRLVSAPDLASAGVSDLGAGELRAGESSWMSAVGRLCDGGSWRGRGASDGRGCIEKFVDYAKSRADCVDVSVGDVQELDRLPANVRRRTAAGSVFRPDPQRSSTRRGSQTRRAFRDPGLLQLRRKLALQGEIFARVSARRETGTLTATDIGCDSHKCTAAGLRSRTSNRSFASESPTALAMADHVLAIFTRRWLRRVS